MEIALKGRCWPTGEQELLLRAALSRGETVAKSWEKWISFSNIEHLDRGSYRLLPLLYQNLLHEGIKHPTLTKLKGIYRFTWVKNLFLLQHMATLLKLFQHAGIPTMVLKGSALIPIYYKDYGVRPMDDLDLLVKKEQVPKSFDLLVKQGYQPKQKRPDKEYVHATSFKDNAGNELDLHWHILHEYAGKDLDEDFWKEPIFINLRGVSTYALNPTDQLFHVCVHGAQWNIIPSVRWVADAVKIIGLSSSDIDWDRLGALAENHRLFLPLKETLTYLYEAFNMPIPHAVLERLNRWKLSRIERLQYQYRTLSFSEQLWGALPYDFFNFMYLNRDQGLIRRFLGLPKYFKYMWGLDYGWQVPLRFITNVIRRIGIVLVLSRNRIKKFQITQPQKTNVQ